jgi:membrane protease YdiL (CAAX protease family)
MSDGHDVVSLCSITDLSQWLRLLLGLSVIFGLFQWSAGALVSNRGEAGLIVGLLVLSATIAAERLLFGQPVLVAVRTLGLGAPRAKGLVVVVGIGVLLISIVYVFTQATGASLAFFPSWISLIPGLFAQAGVAEEILFRGLLFGHLRRGRSFWRAATMSMLPFVGVHLFLFFTMPWPIALAAVLLAVTLSFPFAHLYEVGGATIWAPALLHFVIQGTVKVVVVSGDGSWAFPLVWMAASALIPWLSLCVARPQGIHPSTPGFVGGRHILAGEPISGATRAGRNVDPPPKVS